MAKIKINAAMLLVAGGEADLQTEEKISYAKSINGETFLELDVKHIKNNPMQPRLHIDEAELKDLARSIKLHGLIQPIAVIKTGENEYILKAGQRRWLAHKELGLKTIKAIVQEETILPNKEKEKALFEIAVMENTQRENLNPLELALSLRQSLDKKLYKNNQELSMVLGKSASHITKILSVLKLEDEIIKDLSENKSTNDLESLYEIQKIKDSIEQIGIYFDFISKKIDRKELRATIKKEKVSCAKKEKPLYLLKENGMELNFEGLNTEDKDNIIAKIEDLLGNLNSK